MEIDKIEILKEGVIQIREIEGDTFHRRCLAPGDDVASETSVIQAISRAVWTEEVVTAYQEIKAAADQKS